MGSEQCVRLQAVKLGERGLRRGTERKPLGSASRMAISRSKDQRCMKELVPELSSMNQQITPVLARSSQHKNGEESLTQSSQRLHHGTQEDG